MRKTSAGELARQVSVAEVSFNDFCDIYHAVFVSDSLSGDKLIGYDSSPTLAATCGFLESKEFKNKRGEIVTIDADAILRLANAQTIAVQDKIITHGKTYAVDGVTPGHNVQIVAIKEISIGTVTNPTYYRIPSALLATGQVTSYGSGIGVDDGALQKGIVKAYTILTLLQYSGTTNITINGKTDAHSNNCVTDNNTGLMWSRNASASVGPASDGKLPWTTNANGEGIFRYAAAANAAGLAGYSDWRVPNRKETGSLYIDEAGVTAPTTTAFPSIPAQLWLSTTQKNSTSSAYITIFSVGRDSSDVKTATYPVLLVRG